MSIENPTISPNELTDVIPENDPMRNLREENNKNIRLYPDEMINLNSIAQKAGFKELLSHPMFKKHIMTLEYFKNYCFFPPEGLDNQKLIQKIDKNFADNGALKVMEHERQHFANPAKKAADKPIKYPAEAITAEEEEIDYQKAIKIENQVNLQTVNNKFTKLSECNNEIEGDEDNTKNDIINSIATENVYTDFIYKGIDTLYEESNKERYLKVYKFLKKNEIEEIAKEENRIKKELLEKYDKMQEK